MQIEKLQPSAVGEPDAEEVSIVWLDDPRADHISWVGGKAANLGRLAHEHDVPPGFCLTIEAFHRAMEGGAVLDETWPDITTMPRSLRDEIAAAYSELAERMEEETPAVAVRSSALDEDGADASFAGQFDTYLNIMGVDSVLRAVMRCWASGSSERIVAYREQHGISSEGIGVGVLVQDLVPADSAAVVFSANPMSGSLDEVVINASYGLGESIVSGTVTPDNIVVRKQDREVVEYHVGAKRQMTIRVPSGTVEVPVPHLLQHQHAITDRQAMQLARLSIDLEDAMGWPVDAECAFSRGQLYLLQCRPITTLS
jgi:phosphoenolpyruvate synthase/pyruvate phosphate dikinase